MVTVHALSRPFPRPASVRGDPQGSTDHVDAVLVLRVDPDVRKVEGAGIDSQVVAGHPPGLATVIGAPEHSVLRLDDGIDHIRVGARDRHTDPPQHAGRQPVLQLGVGQPLPGVATVAADVQAAARPPERKFQGKRRKSYIAAYRILELAGSIARSEAPVFSST